VKVEKIVRYENDAKAKNLGYQRGQEECTEFFRGFLETLATDDF